MMESSHRPQKTGYFAAGLVQQTTSGIEETVDEAINSAGGAPLIVDLDLDMAHVVVQER